MALPFILKLRKIIMADVLVVLKFFPLGKSFPFLLFMDAG